MLFLLPYFRSLRIYKKKPNSIDSKKLIEEYAKKIVMVENYHNEKKQRYNLACVILENEYNLLKNFIFNNNELTVLNNFFCYMLKKRIELIHNKTKHIDSALIIISDLSKKFN